MTAKAGRLRGTWPTIILWILAQPVFAQPAPDQALAAYNRGVEAERAGRHDQAIADLTQAIALRSGYADAYESRGVAEDQKGLYDRAVADYTTAIALGAGSAETYFNRGAAYEHRRSYSRAMADYRAALALDATLQAADQGVRRLSGRR
jgi:tetratricopeptide (TPR) repeat protein